MSFVVLPQFSVPDASLEAFLDAARTDAERSVADEPGCLQFDVSVDRRAAPAQVMFYEVYTDRAAFDAHLETPHLAAFRRSLSLCDEGPVGFYDRIVP